MDPRDPDEYLFEVNTDTGISSPVTYGPRNITDEVAIPPPELMTHPSVKGIDRQTLPSTDFKLNLAIYYDRDFLNQFPSATSK